MRLFQTLAIFAILAYAFAGPYDDDDEEYQRYRSEDSKASKYQKNSKKFDSDKSYDRGIEIGRNGLNLKNKKYDTESSRSRDTLATEDDNEETDYTKYRKPAYAAASPYDDDEEYERYQYKENYPSKYQKNKKYEKERPRYRTSPAKEDDKDEADYGKYRKPSYDDARPYDEEYQRYKNKKNDASKYQKNSKKFDSDKSLDRGIEIGRNGLNLKNKKYNTEKSRSKDLLATKDKNEETDYTKYRKPAYGGYEPKNYGSKPYNKKPKYNAKVPASAAPLSATPAPASAPAPVDAPTPAPAAPAKEEYSPDGVSIENENDNKNFNSEKSEQHNTANSENANAEKQEKSKKKLNYKEKSNNYNDNYRRRN